MMAPRSTPLLPPWHPSQVTHRETLADINEQTGAAIIVRGIFAERGRPPPEGERKLYLLIEGPNEQCVKRARSELKRILEEATEKALRRDGAPLMPGKYNIV